MVKFIHLLLVVVFQVPSLRMLMEYVSVQSQYNVSVFNNYISFIFNCCFIAADFIPHTTSHTTIDQPWTVLNSWLDLANYQKQSKGYSLKSTSSSVWVFCKLMTKVKSLFNMRKWVLSSSVPTVYDATWTTQYMTSAQYA